MKVTKYRVIEEPTISGSIFKISQLTFLGLVWVSVNETPYTKIDEVREVIGNLESKSPSITEWYLLKDE